MQYNSGVIEDVRPKNLIFKDEEIIQYFKENKRIRTKRLIDIYNTWCLWGEDDKNDPNNFNKLGSKITGEEIHSPLLLLHDSEIDPDLYLTDKLMSDYKHFKEEILAYFDGIANEILGKLDKIQNNRKGFSNGPIPAVLGIIGPTEDKRALMEFDPDKQPPEFYNFENYSIFALKTFEYLHHFFNKNTDVENNSFAIFADNKSIIIVADENVDLVMEKMLDNFEKNEKYNQCSHIIGIVKKWRVYVKKKKKPIKKSWQDYVEKTDKNNE